MQGKQFYVPSRAPYITDKHLVLGLDEDGLKNLNSVGNNVILVIACGIYCTLIKREDSK